MSRGRTEVHRNEEVSRLLWAEAQGTGWLPPATAEEEEEEENRLQAKSVPPRKRTKSMVSRQAPRPRRVFSTCSHLDCAPGATSARWEKNRGQKGRERLRDHQESEKWGNLVLLPEGCPGCPHPLEACPEAGQRARQSTPQRVCPGREARLEVEDACGKQGGGESGASQ